MDSGVAVGREGGVVEAVGVVGGEQGGDVFEDVGEFVGELFGGADDGILNIGVLLSVDDK